MKLEACGKTHPGRRRTHNEDSLRMLRDQQLFVVADGVGGAAAGEVASQLGVEALGEFYRATSEDPEITWPFAADGDLSFEENRLATALKLSNRRVMEAQQRDERLRGMGSTIVVTRFHEGTCYIAHVGDSRCYRFREGALSQLTEDHSLLNEYLRSGAMTRAEIAGFRFKHVIMRALGMGDEVQVEVQKDAPRPGDLYLLCSDGLTDMLEDARIEAILSGTEDLQAACDQLIEAANEAGGLDNVTVVLVRCEPPAAP